MALNDVHDYLINGAASLAIEHKMMTWLSMVVVAHIIKQVIIDADGVVAEVPAGSPTWTEDVIIMRSGLDGMGYSMDSFTQNSNHFRI